MGDTAAGYWDIHDSLFALTAGLDSPEFDKGRRLCAVVLADVLYGCYGHLLAWRIFNIQERPVNIRKMGGKSGRTESASLQPVPCQ